MSLRYTNPITQMEEELAMTHSILTIN